MSQLRWQCRRGMRELDTLLTRYLDTRYPGAAAPEKRAFAEILALSDPELVRYLLHGEPADNPLIDKVLADVRDRA